MNSACENVPEGTPHIPVPQ